MKVLGIVAALLSVWLALPLAASAANIPVFPDTAGKFTFGCQDSKAAAGQAYDPNTDTFKMIFVQAGVESAPLSVDAQGKAFETVTVGGTTDVSVWCIAVDKSGNRSARSVDAFLVDRTAPGAPVLAP